MPAPKDPVKNTEWRRKIGEWNKGKKISEEQKIKLSKIHKGRIMSEEWRKKLSESHRGKKHPMSEETRRKIRESNTGKHPSEETRRKLSKAQRGRITSEETRKKLSEAIKGEKHYNWKGGISFEPYCVKFDEPFRERCRNFFARMCVECGKTEEENKAKLGVHHVNFDKMTFLHRKTYIRLKRNRPITK